STQSRPALTFARWLMQRRKVDLPEPDAPSRTTTWPGSTSMSMPLSTSRLPKRLCTASAFTIGVPSPGPVAALPSSSVSMSDSLRLRLGPYLSGAEPLAEVPLHVELADHQHAGHGQVPQAGRDQHREHLEGAGADRLELVEQLIGDREEGDQRGVLEHGDRLVPAGGGDNTHR